MCVFKTSAKEKFPFARPKGLPMCPLCKAKNAADVKFLICVTGLRIVLPTCVAPFAIKNDLYNGMLTKKFV